MADRIKTFVDWFIRSEYVTNWQSERDACFYSPRFLERAMRCADAAEHGADGKTHYEVINDWREMFQAWIHDRHEGHRRGDYPLFDAGVSAHWDALETWHERNGSLHREIG
jgi:hypothetical protein